MAVKLNLHLGRKKLRSKSLKPVFTVATINMTYNSAMCLSLSSTFKIQNSKKEEISKLMEKDEKLEKPIMRGVGWVKCVQSILLNSQRINHCLRKTQLIASIRK